VTAARIAIARVLAALFLLGVNIPALPAEALAPSTRAAPEPDRVTASQFRDNPALLGRHPMEVDD
jgi:hypothetical protein